jgi:hypothetical protein
MMAMSEERPDERAAAGLKTVVLSAVLGLILLFSVGAIAGAGFALLDGEADTSPATVAILVAVALAAALLAAWGLLRLKPWAGADEPMSPKTRKARTLLFASGALGGVIGAVLALATISMDDPFALYSNSPLPSALVIPILAVWFLVVPVISLQWHRSADEHEKESYQFGALAAIYLYAFIAPAWWLAARAGLMPRADSMVIYLIVLGVWLVGWFWRRYR